MLTWRSRFHGLPYLNAHANFYIQPHSSTLRKSIDRSRIATGRKTVELALGRKTAGLALERRQLVQVGQLGQRGLDSRAILVFLEVQMGLESRGLLEHRLGLVRLGILALRVYLEVLIHQLGQVGRGCQGRHWSLVLLVCLVAQQVPDLRGNQQLLELHWIHLSLVYLVVQVHLLKHN